MIRMSRTDSTRRLQPALLVALVVAAASPASAQDYTLDDWMTISSVGWFQWSPDGQLVYFTRPSPESGVAEIYRMPAGGGDAVQLSRNAPGTRPEPKQQVALSPDGETLYFARADYFQAHTNLFRMPASGGDAEAITINDAVIETAPAVSSSGMLAYYARTPRGTEIFTVSMNRPLTWPWLLFPGPEEERSPTWSTDGSLAFARGGDIWVLPVGSGEVRRVVESGFAGGNGGPVWSPDGSRMAFTKSQSGYAQIGVVRVEDGEVTPITYERNEHGGVSWSPDGQ